MFSKEPLPSRSRKRCLTKSEQQHRWRQTSTERLVISLISDDESPSSTSGLEGGPITRRCESQIQHGRTNIDYACSCGRKELEEQLQWLSASFEKTSKVGRGLGSDIYFTDGVDNILHLATRSNVSDRLYIHLVECLGHLKQDINGRDCDGMTALEIATRKSDPDIARILLRAGASFQLCSLRDESALHISMLHYPSYMVTAELLPYARDAAYLECGSYKKLCNESLKQTCHTFEHSTSPSELRRQYKMLRLILEEGTPASALPCSVGSVFGRLVETWDRNAQLLPPDFMKRIPLLCCELLLKAGGDPFASSRKCSECKDLAGLALFHQSSTVLADLFADGSVPNLADGLVKRILAPCSLRIASFDQDRILRLLDDLLSRQTHSMNDLLVFTLDHTPDHLKVVFVNSILAFGKSRNLRGPDFSNKDVGGTLIETLTSLNESVRWLVSEKLLLQDVGFQFLKADQATYDRMFTSFMSRSHEAGLYLDDVARRIFRYEEPYDPTIALSWLLPKDSRPCLYGCGDLHTCLSDSDDSTLEHQMGRCIVHVITKMMVDSDIPLGKELPKRDRVLFALELRKQFGLPDITIDSSQLLDAIS